jgi:hypothetical protein
LKNFPVVVEAGTFAVTVGGRPAPGATLSNDDADKKVKVTLPDAPADKAPVIANYVPARPVILGEKVTGEPVGSGDGKKKEFDLRNYPVVSDTGTYTIRVAGAAVPWRSEK